MQGCACWAYQYSPINASPTHCSRLLSQSILAVAAEAEPRLTALVAGVVERLP